MSRTPPTLKNLRPAAPLPASAELQLRVRYNECDPQAVAHHTSYPQWLEMARIEMLRGGQGAAGISYRDLEAAGIFLVVTRLEIRYRAAARFDDCLAVLTRVSGGGRARLDHEYEVWLLNDEGTRSQLLVQATTTIACIDRTGRPCALPEWLRADAHRSES